MIRYDMIRYDMIWYDMIRYDIRYDMIYHKGMKSTKKGRGDALTPLVRLVKTCFGGRDR